MSTIGDIKAALKDTILRAPDVGNIYDYEITSDAESGGDELVRELFTWNGKIRGLHFWRETQEKQSASYANQATPFRSVYAWEMVYVLQREGTGHESMAIFDDLIELIQTELLSNTNLDGAITDLIVDDIAGLQVVETDTVNFYGVPCHFARLNLLTELYEGA